ncbi:DUF2163 domain-containing protein [soil metagenome]
MTALLRPAGPSLAAALASGQRLWSADLLSFTLADGVTVLNWTTWDRDLVAESVVYASRAPWISRSKWKVTNKMQVPTMSVSLMALNDGFRGGASIKSQIHAGLFDGASVLLQRAYMTTPGDVDALGTIALFGGKSAGIDLDGITAQIEVKGRVNDLDQYAPRNLYQVPCNRAFCDLGCTLSRATYTASYVVGTAPTATFIPWASAPGNPSVYQGGTVAFSSGPDSGARRTVAKADGSGLTLAYPLYAVPIAGDAFSAFEGCDKTFDSSSGQSCSDRSNTQHYRGFRFVPPPSTAY